MAGPFAVAGSAAVAVRPTEEVATSAQFVAAAQTGRPPYAGSPVMARSRPVRVVAPAIRLDSPLIDLGLGADGSLDVPPDGTTGGWYTGGPAPGELGPAVLAGHVDWAGRAGVFNNLRRLHPGDRVTVERADGSAAVFGVTKVARFPKSGFPTEAVYGDLGGAGLRLITCGGAFDRRVHSYTDNVVVFADLVAPPARRARPVSP